MKLDENERSNTIRLMKVKDMILKESLEEKRAETARAIRTFGDSSEAPSEV
jgi:V/A-type H+-transporting ATPase subunit D